MDTLVHEVAALSEGPKPRKPNRVLRVLAALAIAGAVASLLAPIRYTIPQAAAVEELPGGKVKATYNSSRTDCGVPLQGLFGPPNGGCELKVGERVNLSLIAAGLGVMLLAFSRPKRPLRFAGVTLLGLSLYLMMLSTSDDLYIGNTVSFCGTALGDLARRGYAEVSVNGAASGLNPICGERALIRLYITVGIALVGVILLVIARRRSGSSAMVAS